MISSFPPPAPEITINHISAAYRLRKGFGPVKSPLSMPLVEISVAPGEIAKVADYTLVPAFTNCSIYLSFSPTMDFPGQQLYRPFYVSLRGILINSFLVLPTACQAKWSRRFHGGGNFF